MLSACALYNQRIALGRRAGSLCAWRRTPAPHHGLGDFVAKYAGLRAAQGLMGHESVETTASTYTDRVGLDELAVSVQGFSFRGGLSPAEQPTTPIPSRMLDNGGYDKSEERAPAPRARFIAFCLVIVGAALMPARHVEQREPHEGAPPTMTASRWPWSGR
jgi:hypothetical protein